MSTNRLLFVNVPVSDVAASRAFFAGLGFGFDEKFSNDECACLVLSDRAWVILLARTRFEEFTVRPVHDPSSSTGALIAVSADSREAVDALADAALLAGATPGREPQDEGFMYGRSFHDLDGHLWEVLWMSQAAVERGPAEMAAG